MKASRANLEQAPRFCRALYAEGTPAPELVASGELPLYKTGKLRCLHRPAVEYWIEKCKYAPGGRQ